MYCGITNDKTIHRTVTMYGSQVRTLSKSDGNTLGTLEMKILRKIFSPLQENCKWSAHANQEFMDCYTEPDNTSEIRKGRLQWLGNVERIPEEMWKKKLL